MNQEINIEVLFQIIGEQQVAIRMANIRIQELVEENKKLTALGAKVEGES